MAKIKRIVYLCHAKQTGMNQGFTLSSSTSFFPLAEIHSFSAKERDVETGLSYFGARYYSSDLSIWLSVDPMSDKYPSLSPYVYCADNPVKCVDPNGEEFGNYYDFDGNLIGNDGVDDGKTYIVTDKEGLSVNNQTVTVNNQQSVTLLPTVDERREMLTELENFDSQHPDAEWGGLYGNEYSAEKQDFLPYGSFCWGEQGEENHCGDIMGYDSQSADRAVKVLLEFHSHGSGYCESTKKEWTQPPSDVDMMNSGKWSSQTGGNSRSVVFGMGSKTVYFYNSTGVQGGMSFENFLNIR